MKKTNKKNEVTISGFITVTEWDDDDNVMALEISADDEDYVVERNSLWEELAELWQEDVEVTGIVSEDRSGTKRITVTSYEVLSDLDEEDEDYSDYDDFDGEEDDNDHGDDKGRYRH
ncbi:MAG: hypothetical protein ABII06_01415 [Pseudomonadota bacterium]